MRASTWLLGGDMGCSRLAGRVIVTINWVNACKAQGVAHSKCSTNGSPYYCWDHQFIFGK